jgi:hypothetical protein
VSQWQCAAGNRALPAVPTDIVLKAGERPFTQLRPCCTKRGQCEPTKQATPGCALQKAFILAGQVAVP